MLHLKGDEEDGEGEGDDDGRAWRPNKKFHGNPTGGPESGGSQKVFRPLGGLIGSWGILETGGLEKSSPGTKSDKTYSFFVKRS